MHLDLLRQQMDSANRYLVFDGVPGNGYDFHAIFEWPGYVPQGIGCGYENDLRQVKRNIQVMVDKIGVLLWIKNFQQGCCRVTMYSSTLFLHFFKSKYNFSL